MKFAAYARTLTGKTFVGTRLHYALFVEIVTTQNKKANLPCFLAPPKRLP